MRGKYDAGGYTGNFGKKEGSLALLHHDFVLPRDTAQLLENIDIKELCKKIEIKTTPMPTEMLRESIDESGNHIWS